jgi:meiosis-specific protein
LDWLELGVFDALERKHLKSVQFVIYLDEDKPDVIYECYTFNFAYMDGEPALSIVDSRGRHVVVKHAKTDLQGIMRKMIMASQNLAPLPGVLPSL